MFEIAIIIFSVIFNAFADRYYPWRMEKWPVWTWRQWRWHMFKWLHFYPPLVYLLWLSGESWAWKATTALGCFFLWRLIYSDGR